MEEALKTEKGSNCEYGLFWEKCGYLADSLLLSSAKQLVV